MREHQPSVWAVEASAKLRAAAEKIGRAAAGWRAAQYARGAAVAAARRGHRPPEGDVVLVTLSAGRATYKRPGESWSQAMNRLTDGEDL